MPSRTSRTTRAGATSSCGAHPLARLGGYELRALTPALVEDLRNQLAQSQVPAATVRMTLMLLQGIVRRAVVRGLLPAKSRPSRSEAEAATDAHAAAAPSRDGRADPRVHARRVDEHDSRRWSLARRLALVAAAKRGSWYRCSPTRGSDRPRTARPRGGDLHWRTLHVVATKTGRARDIDLLAPLAQDLAEWRILCGRPADNQLIVPSTDGDEWMRHDWQNWRRRVWRPAAIAAGITGDMRPYRLRGSFVSLLLWEGRSLAYVAEQAGHSIATLARHYAGVIRELGDQPRVPAAEAIRQAREHAPPMTQAL